MDVVILVGGCIVTLGMGMLAQQLYDASPRLADWCRRVASARLSATKRERYAEEWAAHSEECLGKLGKVSHALGCIIASYRLEPPALLLHGQALAILFFVGQLNYWAMRWDSMRSEAFARSVGELDAERRKRLEAGLARQIDYAIRHFMLKDMRRQLIERILGPDGE